MRHSLQRIFTVGALVASLWMAAGVRPARADEPAVNINTASAAELGSLKGIGDAKAKEILEYREKNGPFRSVDDLRQVHGIGNKLLESLRPHITVSSAAEAAAAKH